MRHSIGSALRPRSESARSVYPQLQCSNIADGEAGNRSSLDESEIDETVVEPEQNNGEHVTCGLIQLLMESSPVTHYCTTPAWSRSIENHSTYIHPRREIDA